MYDFDAVVQKVFPWQFVVKYHGKEFKMRPPTLGDLIALEQAEAAKTISGWNEIRETLRSMFDGDEKPALEEPMAVLGLLKALQDELANWVKKNVQIMTTGSAQADKIAPAASAS